MRKGPTALERFRQRYRVIEETGCWEWTGSRDHGYGVFHMKEERICRAHRAAWTLFRGPIPEGLYVCHHCDNPPCVNPDHLFVGTVQDNFYDMYRKGRLADRRGTGVGRHIEGRRGTVVDVQCSICNATMIQDITANRRGAAPVCSPRCKAIRNSRLRNKKIAVTCEECGAVSRKSPSALKVAKRHVFCSQPCVQRFYGRQRTASRGHG